MIFDLLLVWFGISIAVIVALLFTCAMVGKAKDEAEQKIVIYESALEIKRNTEQR